MELKVKPPYRAPVIERIDLLGEMQAATGCKSATVTTTKNGKCPPKGNSCKSSAGS
jgi:hypothetical protein